MDLLSWRAGGGESGFSFIISLFVYWGIYLFSACLFKVFLSGLQTKIELIWEYILFKRPS